MLQGCGGQAFYGQVVQRLVGDLREHGEAAGDLVGLGARECPQRAVEERAVEAMGDAAASRMASVEGSDRAADFVNMRESVLNKYREPIGSLESRDHIDRGSPRSTILTTATSACARPVRWR